MVEAMVATIARSSTLLRPKRMLLIMAAFQTSSTCDGMPASSSWARASIASLGVKENPLFIFW